VFEQLLLLDSVGRLLLYISLLMVFLFSELLCLINVGINSEKLKAGGGAVTVFKIMC
jgi:hypothetical protein